MREKQNGKIIKAVANQNTPIEYIVEKCIAKKQPVAMSIAYPL